MDYSNNIDTARPRKKQCYQLHAKYLEQCHVYFNPQRLPSTSMTQLW